MLVGCWKSGAPLAGRNFEQVSPKFSNNNEFLYLTNRDGAGTSNDPDGQIIPPLRASQISKSQAFIKRGRMATTRVSINFLTIQFFLPILIYRTMTRNILMHRSNADINKLKIINYYNAMKDFFDKYCLRDLAIHNGYWDNRTISYEQSLKRMVQILSDVSELKETDLVLDSGFGFGGSSIWIAERIGARVIGITIVEHQVDIARKMAKERKVDHLTTFKIMDFCKTDFEDATFDVVWALESAAYASNKLDFLRESHRILKYGGRIVIADGFIMKDSLTDRESSEMRWIEGLAIPNFSTVTQFEKYLKDLNFHNIRFRDISENVLHSAKIINEFAKQKYEEWRSDPPAGNYKILKQHLRSLIAQLKPFEEHVWGYGIFSATK